MTDRSAAPSGLFSFKDLNNLRPSVQCPGTSWQQTRKFRNLKASKWDSVRRWRVLPYVRVLFNFHSVVFFIHLKFFITVQYINRWSLTLYVCMWLFSWSEFGILLLSLSPSDHKYIIKNKQLFCWLTICNCNLIFTDFSYFQRLSAFKGIQKNSQGNT